MSNKLTQPKGSVSKETNKQSISRILGCESSEVKYIEDNLDVSSLKGLYDESTETIWIMTGSETGTVDSWIIQDDIMQLMTTDATYELKKYQYNVAIESMRNQIYYQLKNLLDYSSELNLVGYATVNTVLSNSTDAVYDEKTSSVYTYVGTYPKIISNDEDFSTGGWELFNFQNLIVKLESSTELLNSTINYDIIEIAGFYEANDGGEGVWVSTGNTDASLAGTHVITEAKIYNANGVEYQLRVGVGMGVISPKANGAKEAASYA